MKNVLMLDQNLLYENIKNVWERNIDQGLPVSTGDVTATIFIAICQMCRNGYAKFEPYNWIQDQR